MRSLPTGNTLPQLWLTAALLVASPAVAAGPSSPRILVLNSYHHGYEWTDQQSDSILAYLEGALPNATFDVTYMDWKRYPSPSTIDDLRQLLSHRYASEPVALVLTTDDAALKFALAHRGEFLSNAPVVYSGVFAGTAEQLTQGQRDVSGVYEAADPEGTIRLALQMDPQAQRIVTIHDGSETSLAFEREVNTVLDRTGFPLERSVLTGLPFAELKRRLSQLPPHTFVLLASYARDSEGLNRQPEWFASEMSAVSAAPIYSMYEHLLGTGVTGGSFLSGELQGRAAAQLGARVLAGEDAERLPPVDQKTVFAGFDYRQLERFQLPVERVPAGARVIGKPFSFFETYRSVVLATASVVALLVALVIALLVNVGRRHVVERKLRGSEQRFREIFDNVNDAILVHDAVSGKICQANARALEMFDCSLEQLKAGTVASISSGQPGSDLAAARALWSRVLTDGPQRTEWLARSLTGNQFWVEVSLHAATIGDEQVLLAVVRNIDERKRAERRVVRLATAVEQSADGVAIADLDGLLEYANPALLAMLPPASDHLGGPLESALPPIGEEALQEMLAAARNGQRWSGEASSRLENGVERSYEIAAAPIHDAAGPPLGVVVIVRDTTKREELGRQLAHSQRLEAIGTLAGGIAHDFNNILTAIIGFAELARQTSTEPPVQEDLDVLLTTAHRATELTRQILLFSRQGQHEAVAPVVLKSLVKEGLKFLRATIPASIEIQSHLHSIARVQLAPTELQRLLVNLCTNASLAIGDRRGTITVTLDETQLLQAEPPGPGALPAGRYLRLHIEDTGNGIPPELLTRIFEPFFTTRGEGRGTGLGLAVCADILATRGGAIRVSSEVGFGTHFTLWFPIVESIETRSELPSALPHRGTQRILLVDDEEAVIGFAVPLLERLGYTVRGYTQSLAALAALRATPDAFDVLITDVTMPELTGDLLATEAKRLRPDLPIIVCSGFSARMDAEQARAAGLDAFLIKPFHIAQITELIQKLSPAAGPHSRRTKP